MPGMALSPTRGSQSLRWPDVLPPYVDDGVCTHVCVCVVCPAALCHSAGNDFHGQALSD